jgi:hypothetical protein
VIMGTSSVGSTGRGWRQKAKVRSSEHVRVFVPSIRTAIAAPVVKG